jgi:hypothetical protein
VAIVLNNRREKQQKILNINLIISDQSNILDLPSVILETDYFYCLVDLILAFILNVQEK